MYILTDVDSRLVRCDGFVSGWVKRGWVRLCVCLGMYYMSTLFSFLFFIFNEHTYYYIIVIHLIN